MKLRFSEKKFIDYLYKLYDDEERVMKHYHICNNLWLDNVRHYVVDYNDFEGKKYLQLDNGYEVRIEWLEPIKEKGYNILEGVIRQSNDLPIE